jgi:choline dehydrogenase-like flavoprotein
MNFDTDLFRHLGTEPPSFDSGQVWYHFSKWSPVPNVREHYLPAIRNSKHCTLLLHANVTNILLEPGCERVTQVEVQSLEGRKAVVQAKAFVLCAGGIETARLLLANRKQRPDGIGNEHDLVGRFFQDHPSAMVGWLNSSHPARAQQFLNVFHRRGLKYSVRCTATPQWQQRHRTLNVSMGTTFVEDDGMRNLKEIYAAIRERRRDGVAGKLWRAAFHPEAAIAPAYQFLVHGRSYTPGAHMQIGLTSEQQPDPESRILLSDKVDALGIPRANVRWKLTELTLHTIRKYVETLREQFRRAAIGEIELDPWVVADVDSQRWTEHITDQYHHIGTARMGDSPRAGVVDQNCQVHGIANLYIGSSAVFPTSGHSNPTLTIIALCIRMADRLKRELR